MKIRKAYTQFDKKTARRKFVITNFGPTKTKQALADDLDVNKLIKRYKGDIDALQEAHNVEAIWGADITSEGLERARENVAMVEEMFQKVPSEIRQVHFGNDAGYFVDWATNPSNRQMMVEWGLAQPDPTYQPKAEDPVPAAPEPPKPPAQPE